MDVVVDVDCVDIVNVYVNAAEMLMGLWEEWSFEKMWLTEWLSEKVTTREAIASKNEND